jgi:hypothetical protein
MKMVHRTLMSGSVISGTVPPHTGWTAPRLYQIGTDVPRAGADGGAA